MPQFQPPQGNTGYRQPQTPQYPPQQQAYYPQQQPSPSQQFKHPATNLPPEQFPRQPQTPKRKPSRRYFIALAAVVIVVAIIVAVTVGRGQRLASTSTPTLTPVTQATHPTNPATPTLAPSTQATAQPTTRAVSTTAVIGGDIAAFLAKYGQPGVDSALNAGYYRFQQNSSPDSLTVQTDVADGTAYAHRVKGMIVRAPAAGWDQQEANAACAPFLPPDTAYTQEVNLIHGYDNVYSSATLAGLFPKSAFSDPNGTQVQAGLFDVQYLYRSGTIIDSCGILIGTQQTQI